MPIVGSAMASGGRAPNVKTSRSPVGPCSSVASTSVSLASGPGAGGCRPPGSTTRRSRRSDRRGDRGRCRRAPRRGWRRRAGFGRRGAAAGAEAAAANEQGPGDDEPGQSAIRSIHHDHWTVGDATGFRRVLMARSAGPTARSRSGCPVAAQDAVVGGDEPVPDELGVLAALLGQPARGERDPLRRVPLARRARRRQERGVGLDEQAIGRDEPGDLRARLLAGPEDEAAERDREAEPEHGLGVVDRARERVDDRRRAVAERSPATPAAEARRPSSATSRSWASRAPGGERQWRIAGLPVATARARFRRRFASWASSGENPRSVSRPVSPIARTRGSSASATIRDQPASSTSAASWGWTPTAASSHGNRSTSASAADRRFRIPAGHEQALDAGQPGGPDDELDVRREPVGLEVAVRVDQAQPTLPLIRRSPPRSRAAGRAARGRSASRSRRHGRPRRARRGAAARRCRRARTDTAWPSWARTRGAVPGMNGAAARAISRHASTRSPRTARSRSAAAASPALAALARTHGCSASTVLFAPPTKSHRIASASWRRQPSSRSRIRRQELRPGVAERRGGSRRVGPAGRRRGSDWPSTRSG